MLKEAIELSAVLKIENTNWKSYSDTNYLVITKDHIPELYDILELQLTHALKTLHHSVKYWGDQCIPLSIYTYSYLKCLGLDVELVFGNVYIKKKGSDGFGCSPASLSEQYKNGVGHGKQDVHAWVAWGRSIIVDYAIGARLVEHFEFPEKMKPGIHGPVNKLYEVYGLQYKPMLIGQGFIKETHGLDPKVEYDLVKTTFNL